MVIVTFYFLQVTHSDKQQGIFYMQFPTDRTAHTTAFGGPVVDHWLEGKIAETANASVCAGSIR